MKTCTRIKEQSKPNEINNDVKEKEMTETYSKSETTIQIQDKIIKHNKETENQKEIIQTKQNIISISFPSPETIITIQDKPWKTIKGIKNQPSLKQNKTDSTDNQKNIKKNTNSTMKINMISLIAIMSLLVDVAQPKQMLLHNEITTCTFYQNTTDTKQPHDEITDNVGITSQPKNIILLPMIIILILIIYRIANKCRRNSTKNSQENTKKIKNKINEINNTLEKSKNEYSQQHTDLITIQEHNTKLEKILETEREKIKDMEDYEGQLIRYLKLETESVTTQMDKDKKQMIMSWHKKELEYNNKIKSKSIKTEKIIEDLTKQNHTKNLIIKKKENLLLIEQSNFLKQKEELYILKQEDQRSIKQETDTNRKLQDQNAKFKTTLEMERKRNKSMREYKEQFIVFLKSQNDNITTMMKENKQQMTITINEKE